jgi:trimethylguanosine synthase
VAYYLPRHVDLQEVSALADAASGEVIEVEEEWMGKRLTAVTCYFGGLAEGQEGMFDDSALDGLGAYISHSRHKGSNEPW